MGMGKGEAQSAFGKCRTFGEAVKRIKSLFPLLADSIHLFDIVVSDLLDFFLPLEKFIFGNSSCLFSTLWKIRWILGVYFLMPPWILRPFF